MKAIVPDLISIVDRDSAEPIPVEALKYGQRVKVIAASAAPILRKHPKHLLLLARKPWNQRGFRSDRGDPGLSSRDLTNNYSHDFIPDAETVSGVRIALIITGVAITLPAFLLGANVMVALGVVRGALAIVAGELIIMLVALMTMTVGASSRLSTYMVVQFPFGRLGGRIVSFLLSITLFGWFGVTLMLFAQACRQAVIEVFGVDWPLVSFTLAGSLLMVATTIFGFRAIERLARVAVPLLGVLLVVGVYRVLADSSLLASAGPAVGDPALSSFGLAVSAVVGGFMVGATIAPDLARFAPSPRGRCQRGSIELRRWLQPGLNFGGAAGAECWHHRPHSGHDFYRSWDTGPHRHGFRNLDDEYQ